VLYYPLVRPIFNNGIKLYSKKGARVNRGKAKVFLELNDTLSKEL
jgi:hypothetical protein